MEQMYGSVDITHDPDRSVIILTSPCPAPTMPDCHMTYDPRVSSDLRDGASIILQRLGWLLEGIEAGAPGYTISGTLTLADRSGGVHVMRIGEEAKRAESYDATVEGAKALGACCGDDDCEEEECEVFDMEEKFDDLIEGMPSVKSLGRDNYLALSRINDTLRDMHRTLREIRDKPIPAPVIMPSPGTPDPWNPPPQWPPVWIASTTTP